ncbi:MAG TPA: ABC transporter ATP-binding protein [Myxococcaceae bacterium]|nr:ABC transporter ATP-binding protein [Myxococcaceae bacterium]
MSDAPAIELTRVSRWFNGGAVRAVDDVSFAVPGGECFGLIGPNGAGKTTSFSMMCGYLRPTHGQLRVMGEDPGKAGALKRRVGVLPQDAVLPFGVKVGWLLTYWGKLSGLPQPEREAKESLEKMGLPNAWGMEPQELSHGMGKRVAMAQALMGTPPVLLLDEPTSGLDPKIAAQVRGVIREAKGKQTVVVSSHNLQELEELCDRAAILDRGKLQQVGTISELTSRSAEFRVQIAKGTVPLEELKGLKGCTGASLPQASMLVVQFDAKVLPDEEMITATLQLLIARGVFVLGVSRGRKLEERILELGDAPVAQAQVVSAT